MLIYEKDNKLNISFENNMEETDIEIGKDEVKIGEATISENNVLPVPGDGDTGKVPTVQEDGSYALANAGGGSDLFIVTITSIVGKTSTLSADYTLAEINAAYDDGKVVVGKVVEGANGNIATGYVAGKRDDDKTRVNFSTPASIDVVGNLVYFSNYVINASGISKINASVSIAQ